MYPDGFMLRNIRKIYKVNRYSYMRRIYLSRAMGEGEGLWLRLPKSGCLCRQYNFQTEVANRLNKTSTRKFFFYLFTKKGNKANEMHGVVGDEKTV